MEPIVIKVNCDSTSAAIKNFASQFSDASIEDVMMPNDENYFMETYG